MVIGMGIKEGDIITLSAQAVYYSGKAMPDWVKNDRWIVKSVTGDRAILGKNVDGSNDINSPVNIKYLNVVQAAPSGASTASSQAAQSSGTTASTKQAHTGSSGEMSISDRGVELIAKYEGCRLEAYKCPAGIWTIGYGHTAGVQPGQTLPSKEAAKELLKEDLKKYGGHVNSCVKNGHISFPLNQNQFDALTSFCYNCGSGTLQKLVSGRDAATVAEKLLLYNKGGGKVLPGLVKRREEERALFIS
ncbi:MAG: lysozyme [Lachnospiraceae bacterium]|nr:lysozyme [Lachnospiraceae bacterium]